VNLEQEARAPWYAGVTRYQWLVLILASLGWVFDVFEGQIFVASMNEAMPALLPAGTGVGEVAFYNNLAFGAFLVGGALGGVLFGVLSDRIGRKRAMTYTILVYSAFTGLSAFSQAWWHLAALRFLVALGVGGEWAVASTLVAEVFPKRARAWSQSLFHASSIFGTYLAVAAGYFIIANQQWGISLSLFGTTWDITGWRLGFALGVVPALLIIWVRVSLREPEIWQKARAKSAPVAAAGPGHFAGLFTADLRRRTLVGVGLAAVGLATLWGTHIYGKDVFREAYKAHLLTTLAPDATAPSHAEVLRANAAAIKRAEMLGMFLVTTGGGLGLVSFGPICERLGRRGAFLLFLVGGFLSSVVLFQLLAGLPMLVIGLPVFGFLTLGMHAGYAVYFPELFPTQLRGTGGGFCFNMGRILAAPVLFFAGWMQKDAGFTLPGAATCLSQLYLLGIPLLLLAPETRGQDLQE
jgi:MFS family permease